MRSCGIGHEVHAVARRLPADDGGQVHWHEADLTADDAPTRLATEVGAEALMHLAWYVEPGKYWHSSENVVWVEATLRLLREFIAAGGRRAVVAGTCAEYEWSRARYAETATLNPATMYGVAKNASRAVAERLADEAGVELAWGRLFMPYGPGEPTERLLGSVIPALLAGSRAPVSPGAQVRDFIYVEDVARAFAAILDASTQGAINVATGRGSSIREVVRLAARATGAEQLVDWGALPERDGDPAELVADIGRLRDEVGFSPRVGLEEGVERTVSWWRERGADARR